MSNTYAFMTVEVYPQAEEFLRTEVDGSRSRLLYLRFTKPQGAVYTDCKLCYTEDGEELSREMFSFESEDLESFDTLWLKETTAVVSATLSSGDGQLLWEGELAPLPAEKQTVIPASPIYNESTLKPGTIRGINYYPRYTPWDAWTKQDPGMWELELSEIADKLHANAIRTFAECRNADRLGNIVANARYLSTLNRLLATAERHHIRVLLCLYSDHPRQVLNHNQRYVRSIVEAFKNDGRILGWDLVNEIDANGLMECTYVDNFCLSCYPMLSEIDPNHINNIGFAYLLDRAVKVGLTFDKPNQTWHYHFYRKTSADNIQSWITTYFGDRPFILGECGDTSATASNDGAPRPYMGELWQRDVYETVLEARRGILARGEKLLGIFPWIAFAFLKFGPNNDQGEYGLIREDGTLKPAGELLQQEYARIKAETPAQWD